MSLSRATRALLAAAVLAVPVALAAPAHAAEGPGYGGTARDLTVSWTKAVASPPTPAPAPTPSSSLSSPPVSSPASSTAGSRGAAVRLPTEALVAAGTADSWALSVQGVGFRATSLVTVRVGAETPLVARADSAGSLDIVVPPSLTGATLPGVSVTAAGRNPAGTAVTMVGSIPPQPSGTGPNDVVLWLVAAVLLSWGGVRLVRRLRTSSLVMAAPVTA